MTKGKGPKKVSKVMHEFGKGALHSGSKSGPAVTSKKQAVAIALSEAGMSKMHKSKVKSAAHKAFGGLYKAK